jgi:CspA family cold shock protein
MRLNGTVEFFNHARGFGFIAPHNGEKDVFVHAAALERSGVTAKKKEATAALDMSKAEMKKGNTAECMKHMEEVHKAMGL